MEQSERAADMTIYGGVHAPPFRAKADGMCFAFPRRAKPQSKLKDSFDANSGPSRVDS